MSNWRTIATEVIRDTIDEATAIGLDAATTDKLIESRYPFGYRRQHPYKVWREVKKELVARATVQPDTLFMAQAVRDV